MPKTEKRKSVSNNRGGLVTRVARRSETVREGELFHEDIY
jgi:hypothetical protein